MMLKEMNWIIKYLFNRSTQKKYQDPLFVTEHFHGFYFKVLGPQRRIVKTVIKSENVNARK